VIARCAALLAAAAAAGCVSQQHDDVIAAREAYERCVAASGERDCMVLRDRLLAAQERYEADARSAWGCDPATEQCPTPR
jgi:hypothetical protein